MYFCVPDQGAMGVKLCKHIQT